MSTLATASTAARTSAGSAEARSSASWTASVSEADAASNPTALGLLAPDSPLRQAAAADLEDGGQRLGAAAVEAEHPALAGAARVPGRVERGRRRRRGGGEAGGQGQ